MSFGIFRVKDDGSKDIVAVLPTIELAREYIAGTNLVIQYGKQEIEAINKEQQTA